MAYYLYILYYDYYAIDIKRRNVWAVRLNEHPSLCTMGFEKNTTVSGIFMADTRMLDDVIFHKRRGLEGHEFILPAR